LEVKLKPDTIKTKFLKLLGTINVFLTTTFYSAAIALAEGERDNVNTKYFGNNQDFYKDLQYIFGWITGVSVFVGFIFTAIAMILISKNASIAKMQGNHVGFKNNLENYAKFVINIALLGGSVAILSFLCFVLLGWQVK